VKHGIGVDLTCFKIVIMILKRSHLHIVTDDESSRFLLVYHRIFNTITVKHDRLKLFMIILKYR